MKTRNALTLVELLAVVVVIAILASLSVVALSGSMQAARETKTRGTIQKLDAVLMRIYEQYEDRFVHITDEAEYYNTGTNKWESYNQGLSGQQEALLKLHLIHDLMRMELPSNWKEVVSTFPTSSSDADPTYAGPISYNLGTPNIDFRLKTPAVHQYYYKAAKEIKTSNNCNYTNGSAEMLFLIVANLDPESLEGFGANEIADTDGNGAMEFVDGWGKPIYFIRAPSGFTGSDRQPDVVKWSGMTLSTGNNAAIWEGQRPKSVTNWDQNDLTRAYQRAITGWADPFDPHGFVGRSWFLYPLIFSAGRDGIFDLDYGDNASTLAPNDIDPFHYPRGIPRDNDGDGELNHYDNIHNHRHPGGF